MSRGGLARASQALAVSVPLLILGALAVVGASASCSNGNTVYADASSEAGSTCPVSIADLKTPTWKAPTSNTVGACSQAELDIIEKTSADANKSFTDLYDAMTSDTCRACVFSVETDANWQPIVWSPTKESGAAFLNFGACFATASGSAMCGRRLQDEEFCLAAACPDICTQQTECLNVAGLDSCAPQGTFVRGACGPASNPVFKTCDTFIDGLRVVCGVPVVDAGSDAGDASTVDAAGAGDAGDAAD